MQVDKSAINKFRINSNKNNNKKKTKIFIKIKRIIYTYTIHMINIYLYNIKSREKCVILQNKDVKEIQKLWKRL